MKTLTILIGLPGSGKTTIAANKKADTVLVSSDAIRAELYGKEEVQGNPSEVFSRYYGKIEYALVTNKDVICDATNITKMSRSRSIELAKKYGYNVKAIFINKDANTCIHQQQKRERQVPISVILRMAKNLEEPTYSEGFNEIVTIF